MTTWFDKMKRIAKKNKLISKAYHQAKSNLISTHVGEITPLLCRETENESVRINLLVPSINKEHVFGGISTSLKFFEQLMPSAIERRIILTDASPDQESLGAFPEYEVVSSESEGNKGEQIVAFNDRYQKTLPVRKTDIFIATSWWTAYSAQRIAEWQESAYSQGRKPIIYFIQDYEPCFYPWSSQSLLAESTYRYDGPQIAVFNTRLLEQFILNKGYKFTSHYAFDPLMNHVLFSKLEIANLREKKKKILIYGRPSVARNAFTLILEALRIWVWMYPDSRDWEVLSIGEAHPDIDIGNGVTVRSTGKMSLDEYANILIESAVGVSLMISPHPSYPPLEMAHFGMLTLTNMYDNKNLSSWHDNINSIGNCNPESIAAELKVSCALFSENPLIGSTGASHIPWYLDYKNPQFSFINNILKDIGLYKGTSDD